MEIKVSVTLEVAELTQVVKTLNRGEACGRCCIETPSLDAQHHEDIVS
jgi:hypothetical protein